VTRSARPVLALIRVACLGAGCGGVKLASNRVTVANIQRVSLGMSEDEVVAILGPPFEVEPQPCLGPCAKMMTYSRPVHGARSYPMLWVHSRGRGVNDVHAKRYVDWGADDVGIYSLSEDHPHPGDSGLAPAFPK